MALGIMQGMFCHICPYCHPIEYQMGSAFQFLFKKENSISMLQGENK